MRRRVAYRRVRETVRTGHRAVHRDDDRHPGGAGVPARARNAEIFDDVADRYREANIDSFRLVAVFMPGVRLIGNVTIGVVLLYGGCA